MAAGFPALPCGATERIGCAGFMVSGSVLYFLSLCRVSSGFPCGIRNVPFPVWLGFDFIGSSAWLSTRGPSQRKTPERHAPRGPLETRPKARVPLPFQHFPAVSAPSGLRPYSGWSFPRFPGLVFSRIRLESAVTGPSPCCGGVIDHYRVAPGTMRRAPGSAGCSHSWGAIMAFTRRIPAPAGRPCLEAREKARMAADSRLCGASRFSASAPNC